MRPKPFKVMALQITRIVFSSSKQKLHLGESLTNCMKEHVNSDSSVPHLELDITDIHTLREKYDIVKLASYNTHV